MIVGPDRIVACPHCKGLARCTSLVSGNNYGARLWTDGRYVAPWLPASPQVVRCRRCSEIYWLADAERVGNLDPLASEDSVDPAWRAAEAVQEPSEQEYYLAIEKRLAGDADQERTLRVAAWRKHNDAVRRDPPATPSDAVSEVDGWRGNLEALASLLDDQDENHRPLKAEMLRGLGRFEAATAVLDSVTSPKCEPLVSQPIRISGRVVGASMVPRVGRRGRNPGESGVFGAGAGCGWVLKGAASAGR